MRAWISCFAVLGLVVGCSAKSDESSGAAEGPTGGGDDGVVVPPTGGSEDPTLPPEQELEETFRSPVVSGPFLWSANPSSSKVALIDARTFGIEVLEGGHGPTYLSAISAGPKSAGAVMINVKSDDASVFRFDPSASDPMSTMREQRVPLQRGASAWATGGKGRFAIAWSNYAEGLLGLNDGYQDLTVMDLGAEQPRVTQLSVGFRPTQVFVNADETRAYVVSSPGLSVIDLTDDTGIRIASELFLPEDPNDQPRDVSFTPDGKLALVRIAKSNKLLFINTETGTEVWVNLPEVVTDLDLSKDGTTLLAVMRGSLPVTPGGLGGAGSTVPGESLIAVMDVAKVVANPTDFELVSSPEIFGSVVLASDASRALLFTNAQNNPHMSILEVPSRALRVVDLKGPVQAAFLDEAGAFGVALLKAPSGSTKTGAFALIPVAEELPPRIEGTEGVPAFVSLSPDGSRVLVTTKSIAGSGAASYFGRFPELRVDRIGLNSAPLSTGMVPEADMAFVAQEYTEGRVTFVSLETGVARTVTGFELSSEVVN